MQPSSKAHPRFAAACPAASLGDAAIGFRGRIRAVDATGYQHGLGPVELERRLLEMGFVEGATVEIRHQGLFRRDPIAVRVASATIALRRAEANAVLAVPLETQP
jgi:ferrous iron transport protein A